jgi:hypothetical protein
VNVRGAWGRWYTGGTPTFPSGIICGRRFFRSQLCDALCQN